MVRTKLLVIITLPIICYVTSSLEKPPVKHDITTLPKCPTNKNPLPTVYHNVKKHLHYNVLNSHLFNRLILPLICPVVLLAVVFYSLYVILP